MVEGKGINDMPRGWASENQLNRRLYQTWKHMLTRCYSEKLHNRYPTHIGCTVCERWLLLSNFINDFKFIDGYDEDKFLSGKLCLDKDIKSNGVNKEYSIKNCMWISNSENTKQATKTRNNDYLKGENNTQSVKIAQYDKQTHKLLKVWNCAMDIQRELRIHNGSIITCCKWYECGEDITKWYETYKHNPYKSCGGFIWKYYKDR